MAVTRITMSSRETKPKPKAGDERVIKGVTMSLFHLLEQLYSRLSSVIKARCNKLATIRRWIACYFKSKQMALSGQ